MSDLKVDYYALEDSEKVLITLRTDFDSIEKRRDDTRNVWGHDAVKDAMDEFASNMDYHRGKLSEQITTVGEKITGTILAFRDADEQLAKSFDEAREER